MVVIKLISQSDEGQKEEVHIASKPEQTWMRISTRSRYQKSIDENYEELKSANEIQLFRWRKAGKTFYASQLSKYGKRASQFLKTVGDSYEAHTQTTSKQIENRRKFNPGYGEKRIVKEFYMKKRN